LFVYINKLIFLILIFLIFLSNCSYTSFETQISKEQNIKDWFLKTRFGKIESSITWPADGKSYPSLLLIQSSDAKNQKNTKELLSLTGYPIITMSIALPGIGNSTGPQDFGGKKSVESIKEAIFYLSKINSNKNKLIFLFASGFGANAAIIATKEVQNIELLILEDGIFQPQKVISRSPQNTRIRLKKYFSDKDNKKESISSFEEIDKLQTPIFIIKNIKGKDYELEQNRTLIKFLKLKNKKYKILEINEKNKSLIFQDLIIKKRIIPIIEKYIKNEIKFE